MLIFLLFILTAFEYLQKLNPMKLHLKEIQ